MLFSVRDGQLLLLLHCRIFSVRGSVGVRVQFRVGFRDRITVRDGK